MSSLPLSIYLWQFFFKLTNGAKVISIFINIESVYFLRFSITTYSLIFKNKEILIRFFQHFIICCYFLKRLRLKIMWIFYQLLPLSLSVSHSCCYCWYCIAAFSSKLLLLASLRVVVSGVPSCIWVLWLLNLVAGGVFFLLLSTSSLQSKLRYNFVHKLQQVIGKKEKYLKEFEQYCFRIRCLD